ncbi:MAG: hypothetical protein ACRDN0_07550 [Trebonia sp.]
MHPQVNLHAPMNMSDMQSHQSMVYVAMMISLFIHRDRNGMIGQLLTRVMAGAEVTTAHV